MPGVSTYASPYSVRLTTDANGAASGILENTNLYSDQVGAVQEPRPFYGEIWKITHTPDPTLPWPNQVNITISLETSGEVVLMASGSKLPTPTALGAMQPQSGPGQWY